MIGIRISVSAPGRHYEYLSPNHHHVVYRPSLFRRLAALEKNLGISPEERHQDDPLAVAEDIRIPGVRIWNAPAAPDQGHVAQELPPDTQAKAKQRVLLFPVVQPALKASGVATPTAGILGVRISLILKKRI